jgi:hypothetical protein
MDPTTRAAYLHHFCVHKKESRLLDTPEEVATNDMQNCVQWPDGEDDAVLFGDLDDDDNNKENLPPLPEIESLKSCDENDNTEKHTLPSPMDALKSSAREPTADDFKGLFQREASREYFKEQHETGQGAASIAAYCNFNNRDHAKYIEPKDLKRWYKTGLLANQLSTKNGGKS